MILRSSIIVHPSLSQNDSHVSFVTRFLAHSRRVTGL